MSVKYIKDICGNDLLTDDNENQIENVSLINLHAH